jgi:hypothetical protein
MNAHVDSVSTTSYLPMPDPVRRTIPWHLGKTGLLEDFAERVLLNTWCSP